MQNQGKTDEKDVRSKRLKALEEQGIEVFPSSVSRTHTLAELESQFKTLSSKETAVEVAGRVRAIRGHGGSSFATIQDGTGSFQVYLKQDSLGEYYNQFATLVDVGDFIGVTGTVFATKRGEHTVLVSGWRMLAKALAPLPEKWHGLQDVEIRYRKRYLDFIANPEAREIMFKRAHILRVIRKFLDERDFLEVETPILQPIPGGATARPFITHHNALDHDFYLRIAPELFLKRLIVGGFDRVYEFARCFRNEGIDWAHNPEFTQLEFYVAYLDYQGMMDLTEDLLVSVVKNLTGSDSITYHEQKISFAKPFKRLQFRQAILDAIHIDIDDYPDQASLYKKAKELGLEDVDSADGRGKICDEIYKEFVRKTIVEPTFIIDHPKELSPLAKEHHDNPRYVERFQLVLGEGVELCNAYSELNNPLEQRKRFEAQQKLREQGDEEAQPMDSDFVEALEHGMPPTAGFGMGVDRLTSLLTDNRNIKEVIAFPTLRPLE